MALGTQIPGAQKLHRAHGGEYAPRAHLAVMGLVAAGAGYLALFDTWRIVSQQLTQGGRSGLMHGRSHGHLDRFQIQLTGLAPVLKDDAE